MQKNGKGFDPAIEREREGGSVEIVLDDLRTEIAARVNSDLAVVRVR